MESDFEVAPPRMEVATVRRFLAIVLIVVLGACGGTPAVTGPGSRPTGPGPATTAEPGVTANPGSTAPAPGRAPPSTATTVPAPSAYDQLSPFVRAARRLDAKLRHAAELINRYGPPWTAPIPPEVRSAVQDAYTDLNPVGSTIPAGLPTDLLRQSVMVYSELASRTFAIRWFGGEGPPYEGPIDQTMMLRALANGAPAAARFDSDLEALVVAARAAPPVTLAGPQSRKAADVGLLVQWAAMINGGCASTGGAILFNLPTIVWFTRAPADGSSGTIGTVAFRARLVDGTWQLTILAC